MVRYPGEPVAIFVPPLPPKKKPKKNAKKYRGSSTAPANIGEGGIAEPGSWKGKGDADAEVSKRTLPFESILMSSQSEPADRTFRMCETVDVVPSI